MRKTDLARVVLVGAVFAAAWAGTGALLTGLAGSGAKWGGVSTVRAGDGGGGGGGGPAVAVPSVTVGQVPVVTTPGDSTINLRRTVTVAVVERVKSAVVYISTERIVAKSVSVFGEDVPFGPRQIVGVPGESLGSGFVVHESGYIVTNNHVVDRARKIKVQLADGEKYDAEVISADPESDLAVLKVEAPHPLVAVELGDSSDLMIGEPVITMGNPLGYSYSVSTGIVSAVHREIMPSPDKALKDLIQTDAAINPGNSGGPMFNAYGQVIGINTAIRADAQNIGFAIQVNTLRDLIPSLMDPMKAKMIDTGIELSEKRTLTPPTGAAATVMVKTDRGERPVEAINGRRPQNIIDAYATLLSAGKSKIEIRTAGGETLAYTGRAMPMPEVYSVVRKRLGIGVEPVTPAVAAKYGLSIEEGMLITEVMRRSVAERTQLQPGDVIVQIDRFRVRNLEDFTKLVSMLPGKGNVRIGVLRGDALGYGVLKL
jgi:serine protease Do